MQTNVAVGLTSLNNQIQASGAERRNLSPECTKSRHLEIQIRKHFSDPLPTPYLPRRLRCFDPRAMALELGACGASSLAFPLRLILQFDHWQK